MMAGFYRRRSRGRPSSTAVCPLSIRRRRRRVAVDRMTPPPNMKGVYFLVQIPRSFVIKLSNLHVGNERYWRGGQRAYGNRTWR